MLNAIWLGFFATAAAAAIAQMLMGRTEVLAAMVAAVFAMAKLSVEVMVVLFGTLTLWLGFLRVAETAGLIALFGRWLAPLFARLMPGVPAAHPALGLITMNFAANALGLDNAATPIGLKAMQSLHTLNARKDEASDAQILFLVLNASSLTLLPVTIFMYRAQQGAPEPALVFAPIVLATAASTLAGLLAVAWAQRLRLWDQTVLAYLAPVAVVLGALLGGVYALGAAAMGQISAMAGNAALLALMAVFLTAAAVRRVPVYESFIAGAKEGFGVARDLLPYLVAMLCAVGLLRASGALEFALSALRWLVEAASWDARFVDALPVALVKPFSGSAARAMLIETMQTQGVDSFAALLAATIQGSTETTFYVLAVYFGAVGITRSRHAVPCALAADAAGVLAAIGVCYAFFG